MKKLLITGLLSASLATSFGAFAGGTSAPVEEPAPVSEGLEISGNVDTIVGYQHDDKDASGLGAGGLTQSAVAAIPSDLGIISTGDADHFRFLVDQVEIDLAKEFGENIRVRADIDASDLVGTVRGGTDVFSIEQAYVTWNLGVGDGAEWLVGKFNLPIGLEGVDRNENVFVTYTPGFIYLLPTNVIGTKINAAFNDVWSMDIGAVNNLNGLITGNSALPSVFLRVGANWGEEGNTSSVNVGGAVGPEVNNATGGENAHLDFLGDVWGQVALSDTWDLGFEGTYRQSDNAGVSANARNQKAIAGQLYAVWEASDLWDVEARGAAFWELNPAPGFGATAAGTGASTTGAGWSAYTNGGMTYSGSLGATYAIADAAKVKLEGRYDLADPSGSGVNKADYITGVAEFAYSF